MKYFQFLKQKKFYIHLLIIILLSFVLLWITFRILDKYTRHGEIYILPDFTGMNINEVIQEYDKDFNFILIDSVYPKGEAPGSIVQQDPLPNSKVKKGRNIYYIIVAKTPEKVDMPNLRNLSLRQALVLMDSHGLKVDELIYVTHFARNAVLEQKFDNKVINPGSEIIKGSKITLLMGLGDEHKKMALPNLLGLRADEVQHVLNMSGMNLGNKVFEDSDSLQYMRVVRMEPNAHQRIAEPGTFVNVWYRSERKFNFEEKLKELTTNDSISHIQAMAVADSIELNSILNDENEINEDDDNGYEDEF
jgi:Uncharacterized protein conserved in bacteria